MKEEYEQWLKQMEKNGVLGIVKHVERLNKERSQNYTN